MRDFPIVEIGIREVATYSEFADFAYRHIDRRGGQGAQQAFFFIHSFLAHCSTVARLLWSPELAAHARGRFLAPAALEPATTVAQLLGRYCRDWCR